MASRQPYAAASAANRFGLGARPGSIESMRDPRAALVQELRGADAGAAAFAGLQSSADYLAAEARFRQDRQARKRELEQARAAAAGGNDAAALKQLLGGFRRDFGEPLQAEARARWQAALTASIGFRERIVRFWSNHFAVSIDKRRALLYAAPMEREAIRPHAFGRFQDLLVAVESHPAMLLYLDNAQSIGAGSRIGGLSARFAGLRPGAKQRGLNENLGREIFELHTLGVNGGYTQADVVELAKAITGWSVRIPNANGRRAWLLQGSHADPVTGFVFRDNAHEPGARSILHRRYAEGGIEQGRAVLADLAMHPATARHVCLKLARHFVADQPPPPLLERMTSAWMAHGGDLQAVYLAMLDAEQAWAPDARKFRTPDDFLIAALRALDVRRIEQPRGIAGLLAKLGRADFTPRSPAGFADTADAWIGADAIWKRVQAAEELASRASRSIQPVQLARQVLGPRLHAGTAQAISRADSPQQALSLLLGSPDFQWRA